MLVERLPGCSSSGADCPGGGRFGPQQSCCRRSRSPSNHHLGREYEIFRWRDPLFFSCARLEAAPSTCTNWRRVTQSGRFSRSKRALGKRRFSSPPSSVPGVQRYCSVTRRQPRLASSPGGTTVCWNRAPSRMIAQNASQVSGGGRHTACCRGFTGSATRRAAAVQNSFGIKRFCSGASPHR